MKTLIICDSVFGNTMQIAQSMSSANSSENIIVCLNVKDVKADDLKNIDLLIVGSPTRQFRATPAIISFIASISDKTLKGANVAGFDTRITLNVINSRVLRFVVDKGGYAAKTITEKLVKKGGKLIAPPEGFFVSGEEGPLAEGEIKRAAAWAEKLYKQTTLAKEVMF